MVAAAGLQALDYLEKSQPEPDSWKAQQTAVLESGEEASDDLLLMIVAPVQQLVEASGHRQLGLRNTCGDSRPRLSGGPK